MALYSPCVLDSRQLETVVFRCGFARKSRSKLRAKRRVGGIEREKRIVATMPPEIDVSIA